MVKDNSVRSQSYSKYHDWTIIGETYTNLSLYCPLGIRYLLLTEFEGRTVSYGPSFFLLDLWPKRERGSVTYSTDREIEVSKVFIISLVCVWRAQERFLFTRNGFKFLTSLESKTSPFEIVFKSLARFNA